MLADHHAPSGAAPLEHEFVSSSRELVPGLRPLVDDVLRPAAIAIRDGIPHAAAIADRDPMRELCAAARANEVQAETLILAIKDSWRRLPETRGADRLDAEVTLASVVTRCIREYYGPRQS
jgi:hypothetical protein